MLHSLRSVQHLPIGIEQAWDFFADPGNLRAITPESVGFVMLSAMDGKKVFEGQLLHYYVRPLLGIRVRWTTGIKEVNPPYYFKDIQRRGPFAIWEHEHFFTSIPGGTRMQDVVRYEVPMGVAGGWVHSLFIKKKLKAIFEFRFQQILELFGPAPDGPPFHVDIS